MIRCLREGEAATELVLVEKAEEREGKRGPYTSVTFTDGETQYSANIWVPLSSFPYQGKVVKAKVALKNGYMNLLGAEPVSGEDADVRKYIRHANIDPEKCFQMVQGAIAQMKKENIKRVAEKIIVENRERFVSWSAAKSVHHNYLNGLLYHTCRMLAVGNSIWGIYGLDRDLLLAGIILHDIGKVKELETDQLGNAEYTKEGNLFGHLYLGASMVDGACRSLGIDTGSEDIMLLKHMILSHHNLPEYGAVKMPATKEAYALSAIDLMDSHIWIFEDEMSKTEKGAFSGRVGALDGRCVYNPAN